MTEPRHPDAHVQELRAELEQLTASFNEVAGADGRITVDAFAQALELPNITRIVLAEVERRLREGHGPGDPGPFVYFRHGKPVVDQV